jgi:hypothetical protein
MRKLNNQQKEMIMKRFVYKRCGLLITATANIIIQNTEKYGKETNDLEQDIEQARDIMYQQAE